MCQDDQHDAITIDIYVLLKTIQIHSETTQFGRPPSPTSHAALPLGSPPMFIHQTPASPHSNLGVHVVAIAYSDVFCSRRPICFALCFIFLKILCVTRAAWSMPFLLRPVLTSHADRPKVKCRTALCANRGLRRHGCATTNRKHV